jgi:hypothetical protein
MRSEYQDVHAQLGWIYAKPIQILERVTDSVIKRSITRDQIEAGFGFAVVVW